MSDLRSLRNRIDPWEELLEKVQDLEALFELTEEASDDSMIPELEQSLDAVNRDFKKLSILNMMSDEVDRNSAF